MGKTVYITEAQFNALLSQQIINEGLLNRLFGDCQSYDEIRDKIISCIKKGLMTAALAVTLVTSFNSLTREQKAELKEEIGAVAPAEQWVEAANDVIATVYNAVPAQCNKDARHTASGFELNMNDVASHKIIAMERTFMQELGLHYGDIVKVVGTYQGLQDGIYQIQDTMNKRFAGMHKIDILVPRSIRHGGTLKNQPCKIYVLADKSQATDFKADMAPSMNGVEKRQDLS